MKKYIAALIIMTGLISCSPSTQIVKSWKDPGATIDTKADHKTLVLALVKDESSRRIIEDHITTFMKGNSVASYQYLPDDFSKEEDGKVAARLKQDGFKYILIMRLSDVEKDTYYVQGSASTYYSSWGGYYRYSAPAYYNSGYYTTDKNYFLETTLYSLGDDKLLWTGTTKTVNPTKLQKSIDEIAAVVSSKMRMDGLLK